ncbi:MAG: translocation/assembly module TamB domain-containing protein [Elusimicrobiota bacterium]
MLALAAVLILFTGPAAELAGRWFARRADVPLSADAAGNLLRGVTVRDFRLDLPKAEIRIAVLRVSVARPGRDVGLLAVRAEAERPWIRLKTGGEGAETAANGGPASAPPVFPGSARLQVSDGTLLWGSAEKPGRLDGISLEASYEDGLVEVASARAEFSESTYTARGRLRVEPLSVDAVLSAKGEFDGRAEVRGPLENLTARVRGRWRGADVRLDASLKDMEIWKADASLKNLAAARAGLPEKMGDLSGRLEADGRGLEFPAFRAQGRWSLEASGGPKFSGSGRWRNESLDWRAEASGPGLEGRGTGMFRWADKRLTARADLRAEPDGLAQWSPATASFQGRARASGSWPRLDWSVSGDFDDLQFENFRVKDGSLSASGLGPRRLDVSLRAAGLRSGDAPPVENAALRVTGSTASHRVAWEVKSQGVSAAGSGSGRWDGKTWAAAWDALEVRDGGVWRSTAPFRTTAGAAGFSVSGLSLSSEKAVLALDARQAGGRWEELRARVDSLDTGRWAEAGLWPFPLRGVLSLRLRLEGETDRLTGRASFRVEQAEFGEKPLGRISGQAELDARSLRVEKFRWDSPGGPVTAEGAFPRTLRGRPLPDFDLRIMTDGLDLAFLAALAPEVSLRDPRLSSDLRLTHRAGRLSATGGARLSAERLEYGPHMRLEKPELELKGEGERVRVARGGARSGKGTLDISGVVDLSGADIKVRAERFPVHHPAGLDGRFDADLTVAGDWSEPFVRGVVKILEADFRPREKKEKEKKNGGEPEPEPEAPSSPGPLALDVTVRADRNAWFKSGETSVEVRGNLDVRKNPYEPARVFGELEVVRGRYVIYGRTFRLQEGRAAFTGEHPPDPFLNAKALYREASSRTDIFLTVEGRLRDPRLSLSSDPPYGEDVLSLLIFGQPLDEAGSGGGLPGQEEAAAYAAGYLLGRARQTRAFEKLDLDVFQLKPTGEGAAADLTVGRYITRDLFLSFEQTLGEDGGRRINAEYSLTPRWSLEGGTGSDGRYVVDVLFKYPLKKTAPEETAASNR